MSEHHDAGPSHTEHSAQNSVGDGIGKIATIFSPEGILLGMGQDLLGKPLTNLIEKDVVEKTGSEIGIAGSVLGSTPTHGSGGGGHAAGGGHGGH